MNERTAGRPPIGEVKLTRCTVYLTPDQVLAAHSAGAGNVSDGLRKQLDELAGYRMLRADQAARIAAAWSSKRRRHQ